MVWICVFFKTYIIFSGIFAKYCDCSRKPHLMIHWEDLATEEQRNAVNEVLNGRKPLSELEVIFWKKYHLINLNFLGLVIPETWRKKGIQCASTSTCSSNDKIFGKEKRISALIYFWFLNLFMNKNIVDFFPYVNFTIKWYLLSFIISLIFNNFFVRCKNSIQSKKHYLSEFGR